MTERVEIHHIKHISGFSDAGEIYSRTMPVEWVGLDAFDRMAIRTNCTTLFQEHHDEETNTTYIGEKTHWDLLFEAIEAKLREKNHYA